MDNASRSAAPPSRATPVNLGGELWLSIGEVAFLGEERIGLLEQIGERGSITQAAKAAGVSYKAAGDAVAAMDDLAPAPVVTTATGGRGGGGVRPRRSPDLSSLRHRAYLMPSFHAQSLCTNLLTVRR